MIDDEVCDCEANEYLGTNHFYEVSQYGIVQRVFPLVVRINYSHITMCKDL